jgi:hypothetical protein
MIRFFTEFIVFSEDLPMIDEVLLCPLMWQSTHFDSEGNFYGHFPDNKWSELILTVFDESREQEISLLKVEVCREDKNAIASNAFLQADGFIEYKKNNGFHPKSELAKIDKLAVTSFKIDTLKQEHYFDFLNSVYVYLSHTKGYIYNYSYTLDTEKFKEKFFIS